MYWVNAQEGTIHVNECILKQAGGKDERADCPLPNYSFFYNFIVPKLTYQYIQHSR